MNLIPYIGQYIKVITQDQSWFVGELLNVYSKQTPVEYEFNIISSSKDRNRSINELNRINRNIRENTGVQVINAIEILEIEELDIKVQQGIKLTLTNVPNIIDAYQTMNMEDIPSRIEFGKIEEKPD